MFDNYKKAAALITFLIAIGSIIFIFVDMSLCWQYASEFNKPFSDCPGDITTEENVVAFNDGALPYVVLWNVLNLGYFTQWPYRIYLAAFITVFFLIYMRIFKEKDYDIISCWNVTLVIYALMHWHQNLTIIAFVPLAIYCFTKDNWGMLKRFSLGSLVMISILLQKLPIGWSWSLSDKHWYCAKYCSYAVSRMPVDTWLPPIGSPPHALAYGILIIWFLVPFLLWYKTRSNVKNNKYKN